MNILNCLPARPAKKDLFDDVDTTWQRVAGADNMQQQVDAVIKDFQFEHPENSVDGLVKFI